MSDDSVEDLVASFLERREAGETISPEEFARDHPHEQRLLAALGRARQTEHMLREPDRPTERLGPYRLLELIGIGGMGRVYRAIHDDRPDQEVALKILSPLALDDEKARARFDRECRALAQLDHGGIVAVIDHGLANGTPYLAMEFVRGPNLCELINRARSKQTQSAAPTPSDHLALTGPRGNHERVATMMARLARAVAAAHRSDVLHRDIKPSNVFLRADGSPVLGDFGLARRGTTLDLTASNELLGTPLYMAPEQARGDETDERTDVHGLGLLLGELLTLEPPRSGNDPLTVLRAVAERPVPLSVRAHRTIPAPLLHIVHRACAFRPAARYASVAELADDLEAFAAGAPVRARSPGLWERLEDAWALRRKAVIGIGLALLVIASLPLLLPLLRGAAPDLERLVERACLALEAEDMAGTAAAAERILAVDADHPTGIFLASVAAGEQPSGSSDPVIKLLIEGMVHGQAKVWADAIEAFEAARKLDPDSWLPQIYLDELLHQRGQQLEQVEQRLAKEPDQAGAWYAKGWIELEAHRRYEQAEQALTRATELEPDMAIAWRHLALAQHYLGRDAEALRSLQRGGRRMAVQYARTLLIRDRAAAAPHARQALDQVLAEHPDEQGAMFLMGLAYDHEDEHRKAFAWYERALEHDPDDQDCLAALAWLWMGANPDCSECQEFYAENPEYRSFDEAERLLLHLVEVSRGRKVRGAPDHTMTAVVRAKQMGRIRKTQQLLEKLLAMTGDEQLAAAQRNQVAKALDYLLR